MKFTGEIKPGFIFNDQNPETRYWIKENQIYFGHYPIKGADIETFRFYLGGFAKDKKHCYCANRKLKESDPQTFRALNYTYYKDDRFVWTLGGRIKQADSKTFVICDDGFIKILNSYIPHGFGKDKERVFYYDFDGITNWVRKANPQTFISLQDGYFGKDDRFVFFGRGVIPNANVKWWRKIKGKYNKDDSRIFYMNRLIRVADYESFEVTKHGIVQLAKDKKNCYWNENVIGRDKYEELFYGL